MPAAFPPCVGRGSLPRRFCRVPAGPRRRFSCQSGPAVVQWPRNNRSSGRREVLRKEETAMREIRKKRAVAVEVRRERKWLMQ